MHVEAHFKTLTLFILFGLLLAACSDPAAEEEFHPGFTAPTSPVTGEANLSVSDGDTYSFGSKSVGSSTDKVFTITNSGLLAATSLSVSNPSSVIQFVGGSYPGTGGTCGASIAASSSCTIVIRFTPSSSATFTATLSLSYVSGSDVKTASRPVTGRGIVAASLTISDGTTYAFGQTYQGTYKEKSFTVSNDGELEATSLSAAALSAPFAFKGGVYPGTGGNCGGSLGASSTCTIVVRFSPTVDAQNSSGTLELSYSDGSTRVTASRAMTGSCIDSDRYFESLGATSYRQDEDSNERLETREDFGAGKLATSLGSGDDSVTAAVVSADGRVYLIGKTLNGSYNDCAVTRTFPDGSLDSSFHTNGKLRVTWGAGDDVCYGATLKTDGKLVVIGKTDSLTSAGNFRMALARFTTSGALDTSFASNGLLSISFGTSFEVGRAVRGDSNIFSSDVIVVGYGWGGTALRTLVAHLLVDGNFDTSFNSTGKVVSSLYSGDQVGLALTPIAAETPIVVGSVFLSGTADFALMRLNFQGTLDTSFMTLGYRTIAVSGSDDIARNMSFDASGNVVVVGSAKTSNVDFAVARLFTNGVLDTSFASKGVVIQAVGTGDDIANGVTIDSGGGVWAGGFAYNGSNNDFAMVRFTSGGALDTSFNSSGKFSGAVGSAEDTGTAIAVSEYGVVYQAGRASNGSNLDFALLRFDTNGTLAPSGGLDLSFGTMGKMVRDLDGLGSEAIYGLVLQSDGRMVTVGSGANEIPVARFNVNGTFDTSFHSDGVHRYNFNGAATDVGHSVTIDIFDRLVVGGNFNNRAGYGLMRLQSSGNFDTSFASDGSTVGDFEVVNSRIKRVVTVGSQIFGIGDSFGATHAFGAVKYLANGVLDTSFFTDGGTAFVVDHSLIGGGGVYSGGGIWGGGQRNSDGVSAGRLLSGGVVDTTFAFDGSIFVSGTMKSGSDAALDANDRIVVLGWDQLSGGGDDFLLVRFRTDGLLDTSFATSGQAVYTYGADVTGHDYGYGLSIQTNGKWVAVGCGVEGDYHMIRVTTDGLLDTSFASTGRKFVDVSAADCAYTVITRPDGRLCAAGYSDAAANSSVICFWP